MPASQPAARPGTPSGPGVRSPTASIPAADWNRLVGIDIERFHIEKSLYTDRTRGTFAAHHTRLNFRVIVRAFNLGAATPGPALVDLLSQQARATSQLRHPNVTRILACTLHERFLIIVSEFAAGVTLTERLASEPSLAEEQVLSIAQQAAEGLQAGMQHGFRHGGVCPIHIRVTTQHRLKLADYCWHIPHDLFATPTPQGKSTEPDAATNAVLPYRAPEHLLGTDSDHRADIYSLGATLYHLLTGRPCFRATSVERLMAVQRQGAPQAPKLVNPAISQSTSDLLMTMLAHDRTQRPPDYKSLIAKIETCRLGSRLQQARKYMLESQTVSIPPPTS